MRASHRIARRWKVALIVLGLAAAGAPSAGAQTQEVGKPIPDTDQTQDAGKPTPDTNGQTQEADKPTLEIYGFAQVDTIADFKQNHPDWYDVVRPSKLPASTDQYGENGHFYLSPRQSRFGVRGTLPGNATATFEFDMFGVGKDAGLTTIRLRHAWGQWKQFGAGQTNSQFTDVDVFPNSLD